MTNWFMLPGMGASAAMYDALRRELSFKITFINWPEYHGETSYKEVAQRVINENRISGGDIVGGSSLGGMVALEIASSIEVRAAILLGSAVNAKEVQGLLARLSPLAGITPISLVQALAGKHRNPVSSMKAEANPEFIRAMAMYLPSWAGYDGLQEKVFRLHGKKDHIIPCPPSGCDVLEGAGHLLAITRASETAMFLEKIRTHLRWTQ